MTTSPEDIEREEAKEAALQALDMLDTFEVRVWASAYVLAITEVVAVDIDDAAKKVAAWDMGRMQRDLDFNLGDNDNVFGDYDATIISPTGTEEAEVDLNEPGVPYSHTARNIVMLLAETDVYDNVRLSEIIKQARRACGKD